MNLYKHIYIHRYILFRYDIADIGEIQTHIPFDTMLDNQLSQKLNQNSYPYSITILYHFSFSFFF